MEALRSAGATFRTSDARALGVHWRDLYSLRDAGIVVELSRGVFRLADADPVAAIDLLAVSRRAPAGMICLLSALAHWELTDEIPHAVDLAVPRGSRRPAIGYPPTSVHLFDRKTFDVGRTQVEVAPGEYVPISSPERTVVDMFRFRGRLGSDLAYHGLREYLGRPGSHPGTVARIARQLRVAGPVATALEVLLS